MEVLWQSNVIYRSCGVCVYNIKSQQMEQISLIETTNNAKYEKLSNSLDKIDKKFGKNTVKIGHI